MVITPIKCSSCSECGLSETANWSAYTWVVSFQFKVYTTASMKLFSQTGNRSLPDGKGRILCSRRVLEGWCPLASVFCTLSAFFMDTVCMLALLTSSKGSNQCSARAFNDSLYLFILDLCILFLFVWFIFSIWIVKKKIWIEKFGGLDDFRVQNV